MKTLVSLLISVAALLAAFTAGLLFGAAGVLDWQSLEELNTVRTYPGETSQ